VRYVVAVLLLVTGPVLLVAAAGSGYIRPGAFDVLLGAIAYVLFILGWLVLPGDAARRFLAGAVATGSMWLFANSMSTDVFVGLEATIRNFGLAGSIFGTGMVAPFSFAVAYTAFVFAWLYARRRPGVTFLVLVPVFLVTLVTSVVTVLSSSGLLQVYRPVLIPPLSNLQYYVFPLAMRNTLGTWILPAIALVGWALLIVVPIWIARLWAPAAERASARRAMRLAEVGSAASTSATPAVSPTNSFAIVALCTSLIASVLGVVFGHVALSQIRRTGERGRGLAIAGLVIGYVGIGCTVVLVIAQIVFFGVLSSLR
jgi:hypothetical protein